MRNRTIVALAVLVILPAGACASQGILSSVEQGDIEIAGSDSGFWSDSPSDAVENFRWIYETSAWRGDSPTAFHRMKTELRFAYDPVEGSIRNARMIATEPGHAFRHVCVAADGPVIHLRMTTLLDDRPEELTVMKLYERRIDVNACIDLGIGPKDGLVESFDVLFREDGTFTVLPGSGAYLAGSNLRVERTMTRSADLADRVTEEFP